MRSVGLDLSKLQPDGSHYVVVDIVIPFYLELPDGNYHVAIDKSGGSVTVQLVLQKQRRTMPMNNNAKTRAAWDSVLAYVYIPVRGIDPATHRDQKKIWASITAEYEAYRVLAVRTINKLIGVYRYETGECQVKPITTLDDFNLTLLFNELPPDAGKSRFNGVVQPHTLIDNVTPRILVLDIPGSVIDKIGNMLLAGELVPLSDELLLNAYDFLDQGNYRLAIIEAETGFEASLLRFLLDYYRNKPTLISQIEGFKSFTALVKNQLFQVAFGVPPGSFTPGSVVYDRWHEQVWKIRGDLVHGKLSDAQYSQAANAIDCIEGVLESLLNRPRTQPRRFASYKYDR